MVNHVIRSYIFLDLIIEHGKWYQIWYQITRNELFFKLYIKNEKQWRIIFYTIVISNNNYRINKKYYCAG